MAEEKTFILTTTERSGILNLLNRSTNLGSTAKIIRRSAIRIAKDKSRRLKRKITPKEVLRAIVQDSMVLNHGLIKEYPELLKAIKNPKAIRKKLTGLSEQKRIHGRAAPAKSRRGRRGR